MLELLIATTNRGKLREIRRILRRFEIEVLSPAEAGIAFAVEETAGTFEGNARLKAEALVAWIDMPVLGDDSGIEVDALEGRPGLLSARYGGAELNDAGRNARLLTEMEDVAEEERSARFRCAVAVAESGRASVVFEGCVEGRVARQARGSGGFGYDPIFYFPGYRRTFGELTPDEKDTVSHRGHAFRAAGNYLTQRHEKDILSRRSALEGDS